MYKEEIKRNLLGAIEVALFMPTIEKRFGGEYQEALRSFFIPVLLFPIALLTLYLFPLPGMAEGSENTISMLYSLRYAGAIALFLGTVYILSVKIDRQHHFLQFVTANNWVTVPSTLLLLPVVALVYSGVYAPDQLFPFMVSMIMYTYAFTAFIAMRIFRIPWEMGMFIAFCSLAINQGSFRIMGWVAQMI